MIDRHLVRDVALAVLLGVPTAALSRPQALEADRPAQTSPLAEKADLANQSPTERRFTIKG